MTYQQSAAFQQLPSLTLVAECSGRSRSLIVRLSGTLYYLSPGGLLSRCR